MTDICHATHMFTAPSGWRNVRLLWLVGIERELGLCFLLCCAMQDGGFEYPTFPLRQESDTSAGILLHMCRNCREYSAYHAGDPARL